MTQTFPDLMKPMNAQIQEAQWTIVTKVVGTATGENAGEQS